MGPADDLFDRLLVPLGEDFDGAFVSVFHPPGDTQPPCFTLRRGAKKDAGDPPANDELNALVRHRIPLRSYPIARVSANHTLVVSSAANIAGLSGVGLFSGASCSVTLRARPGELVLRGSPLGSYRLAGTLRTTSLVCERTRATCVEHLFAALAAFGVHAGLEIAADQEEMPLLDGGARAWCELIAQMQLTRHPPRLVILRDGEVVVGASHYLFRRDTVHTRLRVHVEFGDLRLTADADWCGDPIDFARRIAPARTFVFAREIEGLVAEGLAPRVEPSSVVVVADDAIHAAGLPFSSDEPARHKLLDLAGDLFFYGGPPVGTVEATRPGHAATHAALRIALKTGLVGHPK